MVPPCMEPTITESLEIFCRKDRENLVNDRMAWELPQAWRFALTKAQRPPVNY